MRWILASAVLALTALSSAQATLFGKTKAQALQMGMVGWNRHLSAQTEDPIKYRAGLIFFRDAAIERNNALAAKLPAARRAAIAAARRDGRAAAEAILVAHLTSGGGDAKDSTEAVTSATWLEVAFHFVLTKSSMPEEQLSGNVFREIEDNWVSEVNRFAKQSGKTKQVKPLITKALQASRKAKDSFSKLSERENNMMRLMLAFFFDPENFSPPFVN